MPRGVHRQDDLSDVEGIAGSFEALDDGSVLSIAGLRALRVGGGCPAQSWRRHEDVLMTAGVRPGLTHPLGASVTGEGVNFSIWARTATGMDLLLFDHVDDPQPSRVLRLDQPEHRTFSYWHVFVPELASGQLFAWRAHGVYDPPRGLRHDPGAVLLDPYGRAIAVPAGYDRFAAGRANRDAGTARKSVVVDMGAYDWEGDRPLGREFTRTVIYELHVRGFTGAPEQRRAGGAGRHVCRVDREDPLPEELGITAVELMPVQAFDPQDAPAGRVNYWGYSPVSFFAAHPGYASTADPLGVLDEFRSMVKALHRAGIEVILDVVFNHTAEGDDDGPDVLLQRTGERRLLHARTRTATYANFSGCGNTVNGNHPIVREMILHCLRHWVHNYHIDGFRFDLASILSPRPDGEPWPTRRCSEQIAEDPVLADTKIIAEAWDAGGPLPGRLVRRPPVGASGTAATATTCARFVARRRRQRRRGWPRVCWPADLYGRRRAEVVPQHQLHHLARRLHAQRPGQLRAQAQPGQRRRQPRRQRHNNSATTASKAPPPTGHRRGAPAAVIKNLLAPRSSQSACPMLSMGDEVRRTQRGNNNAYCQDNQTSWFDWSLVTTNAELLRFVKAVITVRMGLDLTTFRHGLSLREFVERLQVQFHGVRLHHPDWSRHLTQPRDDAAGDRRNPAGPRHPQRLARAAALPTPAGRSGSAVAADHRHRPRPTRRRRGP